jgi:hypothetical protein
MPASYTTNKKPKVSAEFFNGRPRLEFLTRGLLTLAEGLACIGGQVGANGDREFALLAALLFDRIQKEHPDVLKSDLFGRSRLPHQLGLVVADGLNEASGQRNSRFAGFDEAKRLIAEISLVKKYLGGT